MGEEDGGKIVFHILVNELNKQKEGIEVVRFVKTGANPPHCEFHEVTSVHRGTMETQHIHFWIRYLQHSMLQQVRKLFSQLLPLHVLWA